MKTTVELPDDLLDEVHQKAQAEGRTPDDVIADATRLYLTHGRLEKLVRRNEQRATALGITESDVPRVIKEFRRETRGR